MSSDKSATAGQIIPILEKLKEKLKVEKDDSSFKRAIKEKVSPHATQYVEYYNLLFLHLDFVSI